MTTMLLPIARGLLSTRWTSRLVTAYSSRRVGRCENTARLLTDVRLYTTTTRRLCSSAASAAKNKKQKNEGAGGKGGGKSAPDANEEVETVPVEEAIRSTLVEVRTELKALIERFEERVVSSTETSPQTLEKLFVPEGGGGGKSGNNNKRGSPLSTLATVAAPTPKQMTINVHDPTRIPDIEKAVMTLNLVPKTDKLASKIEVVIPKVTKEQREQRVNQASELLEGSKRSVRSARQEAMNRLKSFKFPENDLKRAEKQLQAVVDGANEKLASLFEKRKKELLSSSGSESER